MVLFVGWIGPALAAAAAESRCGGPPARIVDAGLHRQWEIERDCAHPERPPRLVAVPWSGAGAEASVQRPAAPARREEPAVRAGMPVLVVGQGAGASIHLRGTALTTARLGETVTVRAGLENAVLRGVVRGSGVVALLSEKRP